ncbi:hypothetical protein ABK040_012843 [Willaertia magna]
MNFIDESNSIAKKHKSPTSSSNDRETSCTNSSVQYTFTNNHPRFAEFDSSLTNRSSPSTLSNPLSIQTQQQINNQTPNVDRESLIGVDHNFYEIGSFTNPIILQPIGPNPMLPVQSNNDHYDVFLPSIPSSANQAEDTCSKVLEFKNVYGNKQNKFLTSDSTERFYSGDSRDNRKYNLDEEKDIINNKWDLGDFSIYKEDYLFNDYTNTYRSHKNHKTKFKDTNNSFTDLFCFHLSYFFGLSSKSNNDFYVCRSYNTKGYYDLRILVNDPFRSDTIKKDRLKKIVYGINYNMRTHLETDVSSSRKLFDIRQAEIIEISNKYKFKKGVSILKDKKDKNKVTEVVVMFISDLKRLILNIVTVHLKESKQRCKLGLSIDNNTNSLIKRIKKSEDLEENILVKYCIDKPGKSNGKDGITIFGVCLPNSHILNHQQPFYIFPIALWFGFESYIKLFSKYLRQLITELTTINLYFNNVNIGGDFKDCRMDGKERNGNTKANNYLGFKYSKLVYCFLHMEERIAETLILLSVSNIENNLLYLRDKFKDNKVLGNIITQLINKGTNDKNNKKKFSIYVTGKQVKYIFNNYKILFKDEFEKFDSKLQIIKVWELFIELMDVLKRGLNDNKNINVLQQKAILLTSLYYNIHNKTCWYSHLLFVHFGFLLKVFSNGIGNLSNERLESFHRFSKKYKEQHIQKRFNMCEFWFRFFCYLSDGFTEFEPRKVKNNVLGDLLEEYEKYDLSIDTHIPLIIDNKLNFETIKLMKDDRKGKGVNDILSKKTIILSQILSHYTLKLHLAATLNVIWNVLPKKVTNAKRKDIINKRENVVKYEYFEVLSSDGENEKKHCDSLKNVLFSQLNNLSQDFNKKIIKSKIISKINNDYRGIDIVINNDNIIINEDVKENLEENLESNFNILEEISDNDNEE